MEFKKGDKVVCVNGDNDVVGGNMDYKLFITNGKVYTIENHNSKIDTLWVKDDRDCITNYMIKRFISLSEYRNNLIKDILE